MTALRRIMLDAPTVAPTKTAENEKGIDYTVSHTGALEAEYTWDANLITSKLGDGRHAPVIDLDVPHQLVPSLTEGHAHLYLNVPMTWRRYRRLLKALYRAGIIEPGYYRASISRGYSAARAPWTFVARSASDRARLGEDVRRAVDRLLKHEAPATQQDLIEVVDPALAAANRKGR